MLCFLFVRFGAASFELGFRWHSRWFYVCVTSSFDTHWRFGIGFFSFMIPVEALCTDACNCLPRCIASCGGIVTGGSYSDNKTRTISSHFLGILW
jgi:hypothetical protein